MPGEPLPVFLTTSAQPEHQPSWGFDPPFLRACQSCHRKKVKCDMRHPVCGLCARTKSECTFPAGRKRQSRSTSQRATRMPKGDTSLCVLLSLLEGASNQQNNILSQVNLNVTRPEVQQPLASTQILSGEQRDPSQQSVSQETGHEGPTFQGSPCSSQHTFNTNAPSSPGGALQRLPNETNKESVRSVLVSRELALHLIDVFFDKVAPWLPLLHRPRFTQYCTDNLGRGPDALGNLPTEDQLTLLSMYSLSARYSRLDHYWKGPPRDRGHIYAEEAKKLYAKVRTLHDPSLRYLQGCILLAYYCYTSGVSLQGWVLVGVCVHFALDLGLSDLDDPDRWQEDMPSAHPTELEELRRAWWAVWDLDTYGSIVLLRPFAVDRRRVSVKLPISDEAWSSGKQVESTVLRWHKEIDWLALRASPNQDPHAWYIVASNCMAQVYDKLLQRETISLEDQTALQNEISCLKLALPSRFHLPTNNFPLKNGEAASSFIIGTHLHMAAASYWVFVLSNMATYGKSFSSSPERATPDELNRETLRIAEMSAILRAWSPTCINTAHPFLAASLCPVFGPPRKETIESPIYQSYGKLATLIQHQFGEIWELGRVSMRITRILQAGELDGDQEAVELAKRYPVYLTRFYKLNRTAARRAESELISSGPASQPRSVSSPKSRQGVISTAADVHDLESTRINSMANFMDDETFPLSRGENENFPFFDSFFNTPSPHVSRWP